MAAGSSRLLLWTPDPAGADELRRWLAATGHTVAVQALAAAGACDQDGASVIVLDSGGNVTDSLACCRRLRTGAITDRLPVLVLLDDSAPAIRLACLEAGATAYLVRPFLPEELRLQVQTCLRLGQERGRQAEQAADLLHAHQQLQGVYRQMDQERTAAQRLLRCLAPPALRTVGPLRFAFLPAAASCCWDASCQGERQVGFYLADALGAGLLSSLLALFLKSNLRPSARAVAPSDTLEQVNRQLLDLNLPEPPFLGLTCVAVDGGAETLHFARAGPFDPLVVPRDGPVAVWPGSGGLLGVCPGSFPLRTHPWHQGDRLLLWTAGVSENREAVLHQLQESAARHRALPLEQFIAQLSQETGNLADSGEALALLGVDWPA